MAKHTIDQSTRFAIYDHLKTVITKTEDGYCKYADGVNDTTVAKQFNASPKTVENIRRGEFGNVRHRTQPDDDRIAALEKHIKALTARLDAIDAVARSRAQAALRAEPPHPFSNGGLRG